MIEFANSLVTFSADYADQNERDFQMLDGGGKERQNQSRE